MQDILFNDGIFIKYFHHFKFQSIVRNFVKADKFRYSDLYPYILPKSYDDDDILDLDMLTRIIGEQRKPIQVDAQCVRSVSFWSCGTRTVEHSIQNAYIHMIDSAQHFIYIEVNRSQQFQILIFVSCFPKESIFCDHRSRFNDKK